MKTAANTTFSTLPKSYAGLVAMHMPRPIHDKVGYNNAVEMIHALAGHKLTADQDDYLSILAKLVEDYEQENLPEPKLVSGIESLKFLLQEHKMSPADLGNILGVNRSIAYRILKGGRNLTAEHVKKLAGHFSVSADLFLA